MEPAPPLRVERAGPADLASVLDILEDARRWLIRRGIPEQWPRAAPLEVFARRIERGEVYLASRGEARVGTFSLLWADPPVWGETPDDAGYVHGLAVRRSAAGQGVGPLLLDAAARLVADAGRPYLRLDCWAGNPDLCAYYDRHGFARRGRKDLGGGFVVQRFERGVVPAAT